MSPSDIERLIESHTDYAKAIAAKVRKRCNLPASFDQQDLEGYGLVGLIQAARSFDPDRGIRFTTAAYPRIVGEILNNLSKERGLSDQHARDLRRFERAESLAPEPEDVHSVSVNDAEALNQAAQTLQDAAKAIALSLIFSDCARDEAVDPDTPDDNAQNNETARQLTAAVEQLDEGEQALVRALYFDGKSMTDVAQTLDIDKATVSRRHAKVIDKLGGLMRPG